MKKIIITDNAPIPGGHFSQGTVFNNILYTAGQIGQTIDGTMIQDSIDAETTQIMKNLGEVAKAAGTTLDNALKTTIYITSLDYFKGVNTAYKKFIPENPPSRSTVVIRDLAKGARVEIDMIIAITD